MRSDPPRYRQRRYWDERYREGAAEPREWLGGFGRFSELLEAELRHGDSVLVLGCGTSALSYELHERGYQDVTSIDFSPACIEAMRARYARCPRLRWAVMDMRALAFPDASFDVVLEKGTLDVLLVDEKDPWRVSPRAAAAMHRVLAEVSRVLRPGGRFLSITFAQPHFRAPHYAQEAFGWSLRHAACGDAFHYFLYVMCKGQPLAASDLALGERLWHPPAPPSPPPPLDEDEDEDYLLAIQL
ncbi:EEF1A lysine methyltransferase 4 [Cygnus atratus]|uniref:EEF1A lysine methyltransferase 4 n=1 Tax=Cygnus atratus TaxID=8868 RepID=UPI0015D62AD3|nr:EEF1A lysine methyltransferase 4 [Cygnus atratus]